MIHHPSDKFDCVTYKETWFLHIRLLPWPRFLFVKKKECYVALKSVAARTLELLRDSKT